MIIQERGKYLHILPQDTELNTDMLLGWRHKKGDPWYIAENNLVNRIVLGLSYEYLSAPATMLVTDTRLKPYQVLDVQKMTQLQHVLNSNPMGLGKTPETIVYLAATTNDTASILIITPKIIRYQWVDQIKEWWGREDVIVYEGGRQAVVPGHIYIVNYDKLRNPSVLIKFKSFAWTTLVLDEAHKIKSRKSKQTLAVKGIPAIRRVALTGTPILRYIDDLWSILNFLDWTYSGISYWNFVNYFCDIQETPWGRKITGITRNPAKVAILQKVLELVSIRNVAVEVAKGKTTETVRLPMLKEQRELYRKAKDLLLDELPEHCTIANGAVLTTRLRQITSWPGLFLGSEVVDSDGPKFEWILETCQNNPKEKFVVFSCFARTIEALEHYLRNNKVHAVSITGQNDAATNELNKKLFLDNKRNVQVLGGTIGAMGQGYDGLQTVSRIVIFLDRDWSPEIMAQAEDRLHRMGQQHPVHVIYLECQGSFDQHVGRINQTKADDIREALNDEA